MATLGELNVGDKIQIKENGVKQNYIIVHKGKPSDIYDDSCDGIWLLRETIHSRQVWDGISSSYDNDYENSDIKTWLNGTFLNTIDEKICNEILTAKIPYKKGTGNDSSYGVQSGSEGLSCKVFLLSGYEVGFTQSDNQYFPIDGAKLDYFSDKASRIANLNGSPTTWWLRSPYANSVEKAWNVFSNGGISNDGTGGSKGVRPALILPSSLSLSTFNSIPTIVSDKSGDLGTIDDGFTCTYSVDDADADDNVIVSLKMDDNEISSFSAVKQQNETYTLEGNDWLKTTNGEHTFTISASDGMNTTTHAITFTRNLTELTVTLAAPFPADDRIAACALNVEGSIPADAVCKYEVTNNALDDEPVWEDCTKKSQAGFSYVFTNKSAENSFAFNFRVTISRGASGSGGYITSISGGFE